MIPEEDFAYLEREAKPFDLITFDSTFLYDSVSGSARHMSVYEKRKNIFPIERSGLGS